MGLIRSLAGTAKSLIGVAKVLEKLPIAKCKICGNTYIPKTVVNVNGIVICKKCYRSMSIFMNKKMKKIILIENEIENPLNLKSSLNNFKKIIEIAKELKKYEDMGLSITTPSPSELIKKWEGKEGEVILDGIKIEVFDASEKSKKAKTLNGKISPFNKILECIEEYQSKIKDKEKLDALILKVNKIKNDIKISILIEDTKKQI